MIQRALLSILLSVLLCPAVEAGWTFIAAVGANDNSSGTTLDTSSSLNVASGDLLVAWCYWEDAVVTASVAKDSGTPANTFTFDGDAADDTDVYAEVGYLLSASSDATMTPRMTTSGSAAWRRFFVAQFRPDSGETVSKDGVSLATGTGPNLDSGNISTTGTDGAAVGFTNNYWASDSQTNLQINGVAATQPSGSPQDSARIWYRILTATFTNGAATAEMTGSAPAVTGIIAFKSVVGAGPTTPSQLTLMGVSD